MARALIRAVVLATLLLSASTTSAYIDGGGWQVSLPEILSEFRTVTLVEVEKVNLARGGFRFKPGKALKGKPDFKELRLQLTWSEGGPPFKDMDAGRVAVHFTQSSDKQLLPSSSSPGFENLIAQRACLTFLDGTWFYTTPGADGWQSGTVRRDFELVFIGTSAGLADAVTKLLRDQEVTVQCRRRQNTAETQWVRYALKAPHNKALARDPAAPAAGSRPDSAWVADLRDRSFAVRAQAALALAERGPDAREAEAALLTTLRDPDPEVRYASVIALGAIAPEGQGAVEGLARALVDDDWFVALSAAQALRNFGERARPAVPALINALGPRDLLKDFRPVRCGEAMVSLSRIDPQAKELGKAVSLVVGKLLEDERQGSFGARATGARFLGDCGAPALPAVPAIVKLLKDADGDVRVAAAEALLKIAPGPQGEAALAVLGEATRSPDLLVRLRAVRALGGRGPQAKGALPAVRGTLQDPEPEVRQAAVEALKRIGSE